MKLPCMEHLGVESDYDDVYELYEMPNLTSVAFIDMAPSPTFLPNITRFSFTVNIHAPEYDIWHGPLFDFLRATPSIRELALTFIFDSITYDDVITLAMLALPNIETFSLDINYCDEDAEEGEPIYYLVHALHMPNLSHMYLSVRFNSSSKSRKDRLVVDLLPTPDSHPKLESLRLSVADEDGDYEGKIHPALYNKAYIEKFVLDVARVPFLTSLTLSTNFDIHLSSDSDKPFLPLRRL